MGAAAARAEQMEGHENKLEHTLSLATAAANLAGRGTAEAELLRDARTPSSSSPRRGHRRLQRGGAHRNRAGNHGPNE